MRQEIKVGSKIVQAILYVGVSRKIALKVSVCGENPAGTVWPFCSGESDKISGKGIAMFKFYYHGIKLK